MKKYKKTLSLILAGILLIALTACTNAQPAPSQTSQRSSAQAASGSEVKVVTIAHSAASRPMDYVNDDGESDGYEVAVLREIDALLPQYEFQFVPIPDDSDLLIGIETGKYDFGIKGAWVTEERLKKYIFPKNPIGASSIGLLYRAEDKDRYSDLADFAREKGKLVPIAPQNAQYNVILEFNEQHPDTQIELVASETFGVADAYRWVIEGRYDGFFATKTEYLRNIKEEDSPYHQYNDKILYFVHRALPTWPLFNRDSQEIADAYDQAFLQLLDNGTINEIMLKYLDENTFSYMLEDEYQYLKP